MSARTQRAFAKEAVHLLRSQIVLLHSYTGLSGNLRNYIGDSLGRYGVQTNDAGVDETD